MNKWVAAFLSVLTVLICVALLCALEGAAGAYDSGLGIIITFVNAVIGYFGGKALYNVLLHKKTDKEDRQKDEEHVKSPIKDDSIAQQPESKASFVDHSALGAIIAECNIPVTFIPRVLNLYKKDPNVISLLHGVFSEEQLNEILTCMENGQDVSFLMNEKLTAEQMRAVRENLPSPSK